MRNDLPSIRQDSVGSAIHDALQVHFETGDCPQLTVAVDDPVVSTESVPNTYDITAWEDVVNLGDPYVPYCGFDLGKESEITGGSTGEDWLTDRMYELFEGMYQSRLQKRDKLQMIVERLNEGNHGLCTNALVGQVFTQDDLELACHGGPVANGIACITQLQFRPHGDTLDLYMALRSQYLDLKAYGNLASAAALLAKVCSETGYAPGHLVESVNNPLTYSQSTAKDLYEVIDETPH